MDKVWTSNTHPSEEGVAKCQVRAALLRGSRLSWLWRALVPASNRPRMLILPLTSIRITSPTTDMLSSVASRFVKKAAQATVTRRKLHLSRKTSSAIPVFPSASLAVEDAQLASSAAYKAARAKFSVPASKESIEKTKKALEKHGHLVTVVPDKASALSTLQKLIPDKSSVNMAGSTSLVRDLTFVPAVAVRRPILRARQQNLFWPHPAFSVLTDSLFLPLCHSARNWIRRLLGKH